MRNQDEQWQIDVWVRGLNKWEKIATAIDEWYADEIVEALTTQTGDNYRILAPPFNKDTFEDKMVRDR